MNKRFIYIPSFSAGAYGNAIKKDQRFSNGKPMKIWDKTIDKNIYSDWFLAPAGHFYKNLEYRNQIGIGDNTLFGDSGGFQIASGALKWEESLLKSIFTWLEANCDYSVNLDIPPRMNFKNKFDECLRISNQNFKYFSDNQSGKTKFLNVMQGDTIDGYTAWCRSVKSYDFNGWCLGGVGTSTSALLSAIAVFLDEIDLFNKNNEVVHSLGTSKISDFVILSQLQKSLNNIGSNVQVTTDSSSPSNATRFGTYYTTHDLSRGNFKSIHIPKANLGGDYDLNIGDKHLPKTTTSDEWLSDCYNWDDFNDYTSDMYVFLVLHNFSVFMDAKNAIDDLLDSHNYIKSQMLNTELFTLSNIVNEMVIATQNNSKAVDVYNKYRLTIDMYSVQSMGGASVNEFF